MPRLAGEDGAAPATRGSVNPDAVARERDVKQARHSAKWILPALAAGLLATTASAQVYRWVDDDGQVHFSDKKPTEADREAPPAETLQFAPGSTAAVAQRQAQQQAALREEARAERCQQARNQLDTYSRAVSLVRTGPDGEDVELLPSERAELIERAQAKVAGACDEPPG